LVGSYDLQPGNRAGLFSKEKISREKNEDKRISGEADDVNKQTVYCICQNKQRIKSALLPGACTGLPLYSCL